MGGRRRVCQQSESFCQCSLQVRFVSISPSYSCSELLRSFMIAPSLQWPTTISFANSLQLGFPDTDMPCGSHLQGTFITSWRLAMLVILAKEDSTVSSISCCLQMTHRIKTSVFQTTINRSSPMCQNISYLVYFVPTTFVRPESP